METIKKIKLLSIALIGILFLSLSSCSNTPESLTSIPKDTSFLLSFDLNSLNEKGNLQQISDFNSVKVLKNEFKGKDKEAYKLVEEIIENPEDLGLNLLEDVFVYTSKINSEDDFICVSADVYSENKVEEFLKKTMTVEGSDFVIKKGENYKYIESSKYSRIGWNSDKLIVVNGFKLRGEDDLTVLDDELNDLMNLKKSESIVDNDDFGEFYENKKDINFWANIYEYQKLTNNNPLYKLREDDEFYKYLKGSFITASLDFQKGKIVFNNKTYLGDGAKEFFDKFNLRDKINEDLLNYFPKQSYVTMSYALPAEDISKSLKLTPFSKFLDEIDREMKRDLGIGADELFNSLEGGAVFSLFDIEKFTKKTPSYYGEDYEKEEIRPLMGLVIGLKNKNAITKIMDKIKGGIINKGDYYMIEDRDMPLYIAIDDDAFLLTTGEKVVQKFKNGGFEGDNLNDANVASELSKNMGYFYMDLDYNNYPVAFREYVEKKAGNTGLIFLPIWTNTLKSLEYKQIDYTSNEAVLTFKNDDKNSLDLIVKTIGEVADSVFNR